jgi:CubicO group peptidase (beta-lactamase class C family)
MRTDHVFPVFSVSKLFANVIVAQLVESGVLDLQQPASRYAPGLPARWRSITVGELWNHISGLPDYFDPERPSAPLPATLAAAFESLADKPMLFAPGTAMRYTQTNFLVLAAILEAHYKMPYRQIVIDRIVKPLALANTHFGRRHAPPNTVAVYRGENDRLVPDAIIDWPEYAAVHAELYTTIDDLGAFLRGLRRAAGETSDPAGIVETDSPSQRRSRRVRRRLGICRGRALHARWPRRRHQGSRPPRVRRLARHRHPHIRLSDERQRRQCVVANADRQRRRDRGAVLRRRAATGTRGRGTRRARSGTDRRSRRA